MKFSLFSKSKVKPRKKIKAGTRTLRVFTVKGKSMTMLQMSEKFGVPYHTLYQRIVNLGWAVERAIKA